MSVFKRLFFDVPGMGRVEARPGGSLKLPGLTRAMEQADTGPAGFSREPTHGVLKFTLLNKASISLKALGEIEGINVTVQDDGGKTWLCSGAAVVDTPELANGEISIEMHFSKADEVN